MNDLAGITNTAQSEAKFDLLNRAIIFPLSLVAPGFLIGYPIASALPWAKETFPSGFFANLTLDCYICVASVSAIIMLILLFIAATHWNGIVLDEEALKTKHYRLIKNKEFAPFRSVLKRLAVVSSAFAILSGIFIAFSQKFSGFSISLLWETVPGAAISIILLVFLLVAVYGVNLIRGAFQNAIEPTDTSLDAIVE